MPLKNSTFGEWEVVQSQPYIEVKNQNTGKTLRLTENAGIENVESLSADNLETKSRPATIIIWKSSGGTVYWDGNGKNVGSGSAGSLDQAYIDALDALPSGNRPDKEAHGRIHIDGAPPSPYQWDTEQPIRGGLDITMDGTEHRPNPEDTVGPDDVIDHTGVGYIQLNVTNGTMFRPPDIDGDLISGIKLKGLTVKGQGYGNSTTFLDDTAGQNTLDLIDFIDCYVYYMTTCIFANTMDSVSIRGGHYFRTGDTIIRSGQSEGWISPKSVFAGAQNNSGRPAIATQGTVLNTQILRNQGPAIDGQGQGKVVNCELGPLDFPDNVIRNTRRVTNCDFSGTAGKQISSFPGVDNALYANNNFDRATSNTADIEINGGADIGIGHVQGAAPTLSIQSQTRLRWNGVIGGGPIGGVDLSSTTGQFDGDLAVADGTSGAAAGAWARWDDTASNWQYVDPSGTV